LSLARPVSATPYFLEETKLTKKPKTLAAYTTALNYFTESCPNLSLEDINRKDLRDGDAVVSGVHFSFLLKTAGSSSGSVFAYRKAERRTRTCRSLAIQGNKPLLGVVQAGC
jgi:hypothetical protein